MYKRQGRVLTLGMLGVDTLLTASETRGFAVLDQLVDLVLNFTHIIYGSTKLVLSNGVTVYIKKTDFKADEIRMKATSLGGKSLPRL